MSAQFILAQISDTHVRADDDGASVRQLTHALRQAREYRANVILISGDLANDERADEYALFAKAIADPPAPLFVMPGNHDDRARIRAALPSHKYLPALRPFVLRDRGFPGAHRLRGPDRPRRDARPVHARPGALARPHAGAAAGKAHRRRAAPPAVPDARSCCSTRSACTTPSCSARSSRRHRQVARIICGHHHRVAVGQVGARAGYRRAVHVVDLWPGPARRPAISRRRRPSRPDGCCTAGRPRRRFASVFMGL